MTLRRARRTLPVRLRMRSRDHAAEAVADHAGEEHRRGEQRRVLDIELVVVHEEQRQPVQVQPQRPAVAEVGQRHRPASAAAAAATAPAAARRDSGRRRQRASSPRVIAAMVARARRGSTRPRSRTHTRLTSPSTTNEPRHVSHAISSRDDRRRDRVAEPREGVRDALREAAAARAASSSASRASRSGTSRPRRSRAARARRTAREAAGEAGRDRGGGPDQAAARTASARPEAIADPAAEDLEQQIGIGEGGEHEAELGVRQMRARFWISAAAVPMFTRST